MTKRIDDRFFMKLPKGVQNVQGGTVIDSKVTKQGRINFFMQAQSVNQGTANPVHYDCIINEMGLS